MKRSRSCFEETKLPLPVISYALTPKSKGDEEKIHSSLVRLHEEDPTMVLGRDEQTGEILLSGVGQTHVEVIVEKLKRKFGVEVNLSVPEGSLQGDDPRIKDRYDLPP